MRDGRSKLRELTWLSSLHVMRLVGLGVGKGRGQLAVNLQESNDCQDLVLGLDWKGGPLLWRGQISGRERSPVQLHRPWPVEIGLDTVSNKGEHSDTSVLNFSMAEETNSGFITSLPKIPRRKSKWIVVLDNGVQLSRKTL